MCVKMYVAWQQCRSKTRMAEMNWQHDLCTYRQVVCLFACCRVHVDAVRTDYVRRCHMQLSL